jgi:acyl-CoA reductase-like NAD-dependent aldehyde dehydrogenase
MSGPGLEVYDWPVIIEGVELEAISGQRFDVHNPATGQVIARVPAGDVPDIDRAVTAARKALTGPWGEMDRHERSRLLFRFAALLRDHLPELFRLETQINGRPIIETRAQLGRVPDFYEYNAGLLLAQRDEVIPVKGSYHSYLRRTPLGVCGIITPFNHPLLILARPLSAALAAGNTAVIKPSELTPLTTIELARLALSAGLPPGVINVVTGLGAAAGAALSAHPDVAKISFTGGEAGGRAAMTATAARFARCTAELGGKSPVIVFADADQRAAVDGAAFAAFIGAGQTCIAGSRLLVEDSIYDDFCAALVAKANAIRVGDPAAEETQLGPVISAHQQRRVLDYIRLGQQEGATLACGGDDPDLPPPLRDGFFVRPTVFTDVSNEMRIAQEEIFGPVVVVIPFRGEQDAIAKANDIRFGLGAAVWTRDVARAHRVAAKLQAGVTWINDHHRLDPSMPWGGVKDSGHGKEAGTEGFEDFQNTHVVVTRIADGYDDWYGDTGTDRLN